MCRKGQPLCSKLIPISERPPENYARKICSCATCASRKTYGMDWEAHGRVLTIRFCASHATSCSMHGPILPSRSIWQFWASKTLQKRLRNALVTLQKRSTSGLHLLLPDVFIHRRRFHDQWARWCGALPVRMWASLAAATRDH